MSDIIREVDEELRREKLANIWKQYGSLIVFGAILLVGGTAGWRGYEYYAEKQAEAASARFDAAQKLATDATKSDEAKAAFESLIKDGTSGYRVLSRFAVAAETGSKDAKAGAAAFEAIANDTSIEQPFRDLARIRAANLIVDKAELAEIKKLLDPVLASTSTFRYSAKELLALAHLKAGDQGSAQKLFLELTFDPQTPESMRDRARRLQAFLFGNVVPPAPATQ